MSDKTFNVTSEDVRKLEAQEAKSHGGQISKGSDASILKQIVAENTDPNRNEKVRQTLPLPDDPPAALDQNSADARLTDGGSGRVNIKLGTEDSALREPATAESSARVDGEELHKPTAP